MGNTCKPMAVSFQCMTKSTTNLKKKLKINKQINEQMNEKKKNKGEKTFSVEKNDEEIYSLD